MRIILVLIVGAVACYYAVKHKHGRLAFLSTMATLAGVVV